MNTNPTTTRDLNLPAQTIMDWFAYCASHGCAPWDYDLKQEIYGPSFDVNEPPLQRLFKSWAGRYFSPKYLARNSSMRYSGRRAFIDLETEDCPLMQCVYSVLWGRRSKYAASGSCRLDADIMNSFFTPYKQALKAYNRQLSTQEAATKLLTWNGGDYQKNPADMNELLAHSTDPGYQEINAAFANFAAHTHTLGNCTLTPFGFNSQRHNDWANSWAQACQQLRHTITSAELQALGVASFADYRATYFLNIPAEPASYQTDQFAEKAGAAISYRGQQLTWALCQRLIAVQPAYAAKLATYDFYQALLQTQQLFD